MCIRTVATRAACERSLKDTATDISVVELSEVTGARSIRLLQQILSLVTSSSSSFGSARDCFLGEPIQLLDLVDEHGGFLRTCIHLIGELRLQHGDLTIELLQRSLVGI